MAENIKVNQLETASSLKDNDRVLALTDEENNEVKIVSKQNVITSLISTAENNLITNNGGLYVDGNAFNELIEALKLIQEREADQIGRPIPTFSNTLLEDEIWLEGATVSRTTYAQLFEIYGTTYGAGDGATTFKLPDCRNRVFWGASNFGYISAGLPDHTHTNVILRGSNADLGDPGSLVITNAGQDNGQRTITGSSTGQVTDKTIYSNSQTVQPPAVKVRIKTRFK